jgi:hypothetical protein
MYPLKFITKIQYFVFLHIVYIDHGAHNRNAIRKSLTIKLCLQNNWGQSLKSGVVCEWLCVVIEDASSKTTHCYIQLLSPFAI